MERPDFKLTNPKRKRRIFATAEAPFPVPIQSWTGVPSSASRWNYYEGKLIGGAVHVSQAQNMEFLYSMGFFGKGSLSSRGMNYSEAQHEERQQRMKDTGSKMCLKVTNRRRYLMHKWWSNSVATGSLCAPNPSNSAYTLPRVKKTNLNHSEQVAHRPIVELKKDDEPVATIDKSIEFNVSDSAPRLTVVKEHKQKGVGSDPWSGGEDEVDAWDQDVSRTDAAAFWTFDSLGSESNVEPSRRGFEPDGRRSPGDMIVQSEASVYSKERNDEKVAQSETMTNVDGMRRSDPSVQSETTSVIDERSAAVDIAVQSETTKNEDQCISSNLSTGENVQHERDRSQELEQEEKKTCGNSEEVYDAECQTDDYDGDMFVVDDTEDSDADETGVDSRRSRWKDVVKRDPYPMKEHVQLGLEEAFFLSYGLGCLVVLDSEGVKMNLTKMWTRFNALSSSFISRYIVYHNLRSKGWVPKSGIKYGADFVVYKEGPPFYHSSYLVLVQDVKADEQLRMNWTSLSCVNRVTEQVSKELMMCYVVRPDDLSDEELLSPTCISKFSVSEVIVRRWISKRERENAEFLLLP